MTPTTGETMSAPDRDATEHLIARGKISRIGHEADPTAGPSEVAVVRRSGGIGSAAAAPMATVIAPIVSAGTNPSTNALGVVAAAAGEDCG